MQSGDSVSFADNSKSLLTLTLNRTMPCIANCWNFGARSRHFRRCPVPLQCIAKIQRSPLLPPLRRSLHNPRLRPHPLNR
jgi:hypothetical protein